MIYVRWPAHLPLVGGGGVSKASSIRDKYAPMIFSHETINSYNIESIDMMSLD